MPDRGTRQDRLVHAGVKGHEDAQHDRRLEAAQGRLCGQTQDLCALWRLGISSMDLYTRSGQRPH